MKLVLTRQDITSFDPWKAEQLLRAYFAYNDIWVDENVFNDKILELKYNCNYGIYEIDIFPNREGPNRNGDLKENFTKIPNFLREEGYKVDSTTILKWVGETGERTSVDGVRLFVFPKDLKHLKSF